MSQLLNDVRFALRSMAKSPGSSLLLVLTLAVGLAANGIIFNILDAMVLRGFNFPNSERLVRVWETAPDLDGMRGRRYSEACPTGTPIRSRQGARNRGIDHIP